MEKNWKAYISYYGDHIINDLNKYRKMFLEESSVSSINK